MNDFQRIRHYAKKQLTGMKDARPSDILRAIVHQYHYIDVNRAYGFNLHIVDHLSEMYESHESADKTNYIYNAIQRYNLTTKQYMELLSVNADEDNLRFYLLFKLIELKNMVQHIRAMYAETISLTSVS